MDTLKKTAIKRARMRAIIKYFFFIFSNGLKKEKMNKIMLNPINKAPKKIKILLKMRLWIISLSRRIPIHIVINEKMMII